MLNRRRFLTSLFVGIPTVVVSEKKSWITRLCDLFKPRINTLAIQLKYVRNHLPTLFENDKYLKMIEEREMEKVSTRMAGIPFQLERPDFPYNSSFKGNLHPYFDVKYISRASNS